MRTLNYKTIRLRPSLIKEYNIPKRIRVVNDGYYLFFNCQHLLLELTPLGRSFFDYLCERMDHYNNSILINKELKNRFSEHISSITSTKYQPKIDAINSYVAGLKELGLIVPDPKQRALYYVNPKYACKASKSQRGLLLKKLIEERCEANEDVSMLINTSQSLKKNNI